MSAISEEQQGYEATFVEDISEDLKCVICRLVLRNPIQIMRCGHRLCNACFERMRKHSQQW